MRSELQSILHDLRQMARADLPALIGDLAVVQAEAQLRLIGSTPIGSEPRSTPPAEFFSVDDIASRWRCSRGTVYNRLRSVGALALDFTSKKQSRSKRSVPRSTVLQIEEKFSRRIS